MTAKLLSIALGGALGAVLRAVLSDFPAKYINSSFPYGTLLVNVLGSFLMGLLWQLMERSVVNPALKPLLLTGFLGALTTFSTYSLDNLKLFEGGLSGVAVANIVVSHLLGLGAVFVGVVFGRNILLN